MQNLFGLNSGGYVFTLRYGNTIDAATDGLRATEDTLVRGLSTDELVENTLIFQRMPSKWDHSESQKNSMGQKRSPFWRLLARQNRIEA